MVDPLWIRRQSSVQDQSEFLYSLLGRRASRVSTKHTSLCVRACCASRAQQACVRTFALDKALVAKQRRRRHDRKKRRDET